MNRRIVSHTGPLLHLHEAGLLELLKESGDIFIPEAVDIELRYQLGNWEKPPWLHLAALDPVHDAEAKDWQNAGLLDWGEAEAIALVRMIEADWFLTDDAAARLVAKGFGFEVHGSLGVVLWCAAKGHLKPQEAEIALQALATSSLWLSSRVLSEAQKALTEMFSDPT